MSNLTNLIGAAVGIAAILIAGFALIEQRRQTRVMEAQVDKQVEIKISRDLEDAPDSSPRSVIDSKLRTYLNNRLSKVRGDMRDEFDRRFDEIAHKDVAVEAVKLLSAQRDAVARFEESSNRVAMLEQEIQSLQRALEDMRNGAGNSAMVRAQIRRIAELLLSVTGQDRASNNWSISDTPPITDTPQTEPMGFMADDP